MRVCKVILFRFLCWEGIDAKSQETAISRAFWLGGNDAGRTRRHRVYIIDYRLNTSFMERNCKN